MYELHYASLEQEGNIPVYGFETFDKLVDFSIDKAMINKGRSVYLISKDFHTACPFVTDNPNDIPYILTKMPSMGFKSATFIQEYKSFEEAYKVALLITEKRPLCY